MKKGQQWFERMIWCCIAVTGFYIIYRGTGILAETGWAERMFGSEKSVEVMEEAAVELVLPGYLAALEEQTEDSFVGQWLDQFVPVVRQWMREAMEEAARGEESDRAEKVQAEGRLHGGAKEPGERENQAGAEESKAGENQSGAEEPEEEENQSGAEAPEDGEVREEPEASEEEETQKESGSPENGKTHTGTEVPEERTSRTEGEAQEGEKAREEGENETEAQQETEVQQETETQTEETDILLEEDSEKETEAAREASASFSARLEDFDYLLNHYFVVDSDTSVDAGLLDADTLLTKDFSMEKNPQVPQILIYHTHSQEFFVDSDPTDLTTGIVGIGDYLTELLEERYGYQVIHDRGVYDLVDGILDRSAAYDYARAAMEPVLEENPTIQVVIDLHRDGVEGEHFVTEIEGEQAARIMFFNGLSRNSEGVSAEYLYNPYIEDNLGFSLQLQLAAERLYPGFTRNIYLKGQRFNLHLRPRSLLVESGTQLNTIREEQKAMEVLADLLNRVLGGE